MVREARPEDLGPLLALYRHLHETGLPEETEALRAAWGQILADEGHHVLVCELDGALVSSCVCVVVPNLTRGGRPYALVENVVTHRDYRRLGLASACLARARELAEARNCYKIMLLTGAKEPGTLDFYRKAG